MGSFPVGGQRLPAEGCWWVMAPMMRAFRGPATTATVTSSDPLIRAMAIQAADGSWSVAVANRRPAEATVGIDLPASARGRSWHAWRWDPARWTYPATGAAGANHADLPPPEPIAGQPGRILVTVARDGVATLATAAHRNPLPPVAGMAIRRLPSRGATLSWMQARLSQRSCLCILRQRGKAIRHWPARPRAVRRQRPKIAPQTSAPRIMANGAAMVIQNANRSSRMRSACGFRTGINP